MPKNEGNNFHELSEEEIASSTVFSKPLQKDNPKEEKNGGTKVAVKTITAVFLAVLIVGASVFLYSAFGKKENTSSASSNVTSSEVADPLISVIKRDINKVSAITLKNASGKMEFYPEKSNEDTDDDSSPDNLWYFKGVKKSLVDTEYSGITASDCTDLKALVKRTYSKSEDYGLSEPYAEVSVKSEEGDYEFTIGKPFENGNMKGAYLKLSTDSDNIYILPDANVKLFGESEKHYINRSLPTAIEQTDKNSDYFETSLSKFDYTEIKNTSGEKMRFEMYGRSVSSIIYRMTSPYSVPASGDKVGEIVATMQENLEATDIYYYSSDGIDDATYKKFSLSSPAAYYEYKVGGEKVKITLYPAPDINFFAATVKGIPAIYKVAKTDIPFIEYKAYEYVSPTVLIDDITKTSKFTLTKDGKKYTFDISTKLAESEDDEDVTTVTYGGKKIDFENFSNFYQYVISVNPYVSDDGILKERPEKAKKYFSVTLTPLSTTGDKAVTLTVYKVPSNKTRYYLELDGKPIGLCYTAYPDMIYEKIDDLISDKKIESVEE